MRAPLGAHIGKRQQHYAMQLTVKHGVISEHQTAKPYKTQAIA